MLDCLDVTEGMSMDGSGKRAPILVVDSTLREGEQSPHIYFTPEQRLEIAQRLDQVGVDIIDAGNPVVDAGIQCGIEKIVRSGLRARVGVHVRCRIDDAHRALQSGAGFLGTFFGLADDRLSRDYRLTPLEAYRRIEQVVGSSRRASPELVIRFTVEDALRCPWDRIVEAAIVAAGAGADIICLADTTGQADPFLPDRSLGLFVEKLGAALSVRGLAAKVAVHCHDDRGLALANALDALAHGANVVDGSVLGLGERAGIVDLASLLWSVDEREGATRRHGFMYLPALYQFVSELTQVQIALNRPLVGANAFTHTCGVHAKAFYQDPEAYQSLPAEVFGRKWQVALGVQSGRSSVSGALRQIGHPRLADDQEMVETILAEVKRIGRKGGTIRIDHEFRAIAERMVDRWSRRTMADT